MSVVGLLTDMPLYVGQGQRNAAYYYADRLAQAMALLDSIGWYGHDETYGSVSEGARELALEEIAAIEEQLDADECDLNELEAADKRDAIQAFRVLAEAGT